MEIHMNHVRIAMLGSGFVASYYMDALANVNGQEVVANYSRNLQRAQEFAKRWSIPDHSTDLEKLIERDDIDLFVIALPNEAHLPVSLALSKARRNQVCTKPLGRSRQEAKAMLVAAKDSGALHCYAETEVFSPCVVKARQVIEKGGVGRVLWVRSRESHAGPPTATHGWDTHWWDVKKTGGGALLDLGCHCIEAARYFFGKQDPIVEVMAWADRLIHTRTEGEDNALVVLRFASGGIAQCELSWTCKGGLDLRNEIHGDQGSIFTDVTRGTPITAFTTKSAGHIVEQAEMDVGWTQPLPEEAFSYGYQAEMRHFVECVRDKTLPRENFEDGYIVNSVIETCYESIKSRRWVPFEY
jgi:predicted dehydrogenase